MDRQEETPQDIAALKVMQEATTKALKDPKKMADLILTGVHNQTTVDLPAAGQEDPGEGFVSAEEATPGDVTVEEVEGSLVKPAPKVRLPPSLKALPEQVPSTQRVKGTILDQGHLKVRAVTEVEEEVATSNEDDAPTSEASEVASITIQMRELSGVVNNLNATVAQAMSNIETRLAGLEVRVGEIEGKPQRHRKIISTELLPLQLPMMSGALPFKQEATSGSELLELVSSYKFTPSKLSQKQLLLQMTDGKDISKIKLPLTRQEWKPENLAKLLQGLQ